MADTFHCPSGSGDKPGVYIKTFGCQMNEYDSEKMLMLLCDCYSPVSSPEEADLILVNTCSVRAKAENKLYSLLGRFIALKRQKPDLVIGVGGCVAQQEGEKIARRSRVVDFVVGTHNLSLIPSLVEAAKEGAKPQVAVDYRDEWDNFSPDLESSLKVSDASGVSPARALVAIQRGCNKRCAFCVVPSTRGPERSRVVDEIEREIRHKVQLGAREVMLLGQTVNSYGRDLETPCSFTELLRRVAGIDGVRRIRFTSPHPADVGADFGYLYREIPQLCPHIHLPLQSGSDRILKLMNRNYRSEHYKKLVSELKERCPDIAISTDIIVGYPTETDEDFEKTLEMLSFVRYNCSYSFKYSRRPNTSATRRFGEEQEVDAEVAQRRLVCLQRLQDEISLEINEQRVGSEVEVLVEGVNKKISSNMRGRIPQNTSIELVGGLPQPGDVVSAVVERAGPHGLLGRVE